MIMREIYRDIDGARCFKVMEIDGDSDEFSKLVPRQTEMSWNRRINV